MMSDLGYDAVIFDLDGTLYRGRSVIPGAIEALDALRGSVACRFLSNNGERRSTALTQRLRDMGFSVEPEDVISSADLVVGYMSSRRRAERVLALCSDDLTHALADQGSILVSDASADVIVLGVDRQLTRERLVNGLRAALNGADIVATNEDPTYPREDGLRPAAGAYVGFFRGMGFEPVRFCGKPDRIAVRSALEQWGISHPSRCLFVGDNLRTDIAAANQLGANSILVLTGVSTRASTSGDEGTPTAVLPSVADLDVDCLRSLPAHARMSAGSRYGIDG
jgi:4-nitrophenyl phosphatase